MGKRPLYLAVPSWIGLTPDSPKSSVSGCTDDAGASVQAGTDTRCSAGFWEAKGELGVHSAHNGEMEMGDPLESVYCTTSAVGWSDSVVRSWYKTTQGTLRMGTDT